MPDERIISVDSHIEIAPDRWTHWVAEQYRGRAPRRIRLADGTDGFVIEGQPMYKGGPNFFAGSTPETYRPLGVHWEEMPGAGDGTQRLRELDEDGLEAEVLFNGVGAGMMWRGLSERAAYLALLRGYNDFMAQEFCAVAPDRLLGLGVIPETGLEDAVAELEYCAKIGLKGVSISGFPSAHAYPTLDDDRFWAAALDLNMPLCVHIAFSIGQNSWAPASKERPMKYPLEPQGDARPNADFFGRLTIYARAGGLNAVQMMLGGVFDRFPRLRVFFAENQIGWIPNFLEQLDNNYRVNCHWAEEYFGVKRLARRPSDYIKEHCYWGFMYNPIGVELRHHVGIDRVMWEADFPHCETDWPNSRDIIDEMMDGVPDDERRKMLAGNASEFFHLTPAATTAPPPALAR
jgi:predicted TIM-barrel fold metal-dependent hydrolase